MSRTSLATATGKDGPRSRTQLHVGEEAQRAPAGAAFEEADDVDPELHVLRRRAHVRVQEESEEDARV